MKKSATVSKIFKILDGLITAAATTAEIIDWVIPDYHETYRRMRGLPVKPYEPKHSIFRRINTNNPEEEELHRLYNIISWLKRDGLIEKKKNGRWRATTKGKERWAKIIERLKNPLPSTRYQKDDSKELKIIVFDIPEKEKRKREWLRRALNALGFKMLQKSVWIGRSKLPEEFINDLAKLHLLSYIEILAITKSGSLRHISTIISDR
mgnify:CR=1 FL=1